MTQRPTIADLKSMLEQQQEKSSRRRPKSNSSIRVPVPIPPNRSQVSRDKRRLLSEIFTPDECKALAQFTMDLKKSDCRAKTTTPEQTEVLSDAIVKLRERLEYEGYTEHRRK